MHSPIRLRPFQLSDLDTFADAYDKTWGWELSPDPERPERMRHAFVYVIGNLLKSDVIRVAELPDGRPAALMCARLDPKSEPVAPDAELTGLRERHQSLATLQKETELGRSCLGFEEGLHSVNRKMLADYVARAGGSMDDRPELVFLIAHPIARRRGCAGALLRLFESEARQKGAGEAVLFTDNDCVTAIYTRNGWRREGEVPWKIDENEDFKSWLYVKTF